jgi:hypothetical protein
VTHSTDPAMNAALEADAALLLALGGDPGPTLEDLGDTCELCFRPMRPDEIDRECVKATGFLVCETCVEETLQGHVNAPY